jgi:hypothetical protein
LDFLIVVIDSKSRSVTFDETAAIDAFNEKPDANDQLVAACGVSDSVEATGMNSRAGLGVVTSGPLHATDEFRASFRVVRAQDPAEALQLAAAGPSTCNR